MKVEEVAVDVPVLDPENLRLHPERNLDGITRSLQRYGQQTPIVLDAAGVVRKGNGTLLAARALGWERIWIVRSELEGRDAAEYALVDNRTGETSAWDWEALSAFLHDRGDVPIEDFGFTDDELAQMVDAEWSIEAAERERMAGYKAEADTFLIKVEGVKPDDKDRVLEAINGALADDEYEAVAY